MIVQSAVSFVPVSVGGVRCMGMYRLGWRAPANLRQGTAAKVQSRSASARPCRPMDGSCGSCMACGRSKQSRGFKALPAFQSGHADRRDRARPSHHPQCSTSCSGAMPVGTFSAASWKAAKRVGGQTSSAPVSTQNCFASLSMKSQSGNRG